jgi:hypothetical protein
MEPRQAPLVKEISPGRLTVAWGKDLFDTFPSDVGLGDLRGTYRGRRREGGFVVVTIDDEHMGRFMGIVGSKHEESVPASFARYAALRRLETSMKQSGQYV